MKRCMPCKTFVFAACILIYTTPACASTSAKEAIALKRVYEYWKEDDLRASKTEALRFLERYPTSLHKDGLLALIADMYLVEKDYKAALVAIEEIESQEKNKELYYHRAICLYELKKFDELIAFVPKILAAPVRIEEKETLELFLARALVYQAENAKTQIETKQLKEQALFHFENIVRGKHKEIALVHAAEISLFLERYSKASKYFKELLELWPEEREKILYNLSLSLLGDKKSAAAIKTLSSVYKLKGEKAAVAALLQLQTLYNEKKYKELLLYQEEAMRHIDSSSKAKAHEFIGNALFYLHDYAQACQHLTLALEKGSLSEEKKGQVLRQLLACYSKTKNKKLLEETLASAASIYLTDQELSQGHILAMDLCTQEEKSKAADHLAKALELDPSHPDNMKRKMELASLYHHLGNYEKTNDLCQGLLSSTMSDKDRSLVGKILLSAAMDSVESAEPLPAAMLLRWALQESHILNADEKKIALYNLFHLHMKESELASAAKIIKDLHDVGFARDKLFCSYLALARAHEKDVDSSFYIEFLEQALFLQDDEEKKAPLLLSLYNGYIALAKQTQDPREKAAKLKSAADSLYSAYDRSLYIPPSSLHWLAQQLFCLSGSDAEGIAYAAKARAVLQDLLQIRCYPPKLTITQENIGDELHVMRLAGVLDILGLTNEKIDTLETLVQLQSERPSWPWRYERQSLFELANSYEQCGKIQQAVEALSRVIQKTKAQSSKLAMQAKLKKAELNFLLLKKGNDIDTHGIAQDLKDLDIYRKLESEPIHIEASLTYIELKTYLSEEKERPTKKIEMLINLKKHLEDKVEAAHYLAEADKYPYQDKIRLAYIDYIDACAAMTAAKTQDSSLEQEAKQKASLLVKKINDLTPMPTALSLRIKEISP